ncbi:G-alpha-domain-containing protein [Dentipellis sp. KUC8613]|nr:G-alpha-domain-containing protein [Dentipellis sp. KUC8613]
MPKNVPDDDDPLARALRPPPDETPAARAVRQAREADARRVSQAIDDAIRAERQANKKKKIVRVLLLGQSESGKSTTLRQFQRLYTPSAFRSELVHWRAIIQLNLIRSIHTILAALNANANANSGPTHSPAPSRSLAWDGDDFDVPDDDAYLSDPASSVRPSLAPSASPSAPTSDTDDGPPLDLAALALRLLPLRHAEAFLRAQLVPPAEDEAADLGHGLPGHAHAPSHHSSFSSSSSASASSAGKEVFVRPGRWRASFWKRGGVRACAAGAGAEEDEPQRVIWRCREDMMRLWASRRVRRVLKAKKVRLEEESGFFLDDLPRLTECNYVPTEDDVLRARLKTIGVSEYKFQMEAGPQSGSEWRIVDVGGSRFQRPTWAPFFDDVDAIIFLAPISCFDQVLAEDAKVNRLEDSVLLWKAVCSNKLLAHVDLVLFLNKCDLLARKLAGGTRLARYVRSYADRANDVETAGKYFRGKFSAIQRTYSPAPRKFYGFCTSVTDTVTTSGILVSVRDIVLRQNLRQSKLV